MLVGIPCVWLILVALGGGCFAEVLFFGFWFLTIVVSCTGVVTGIQGLRRQGNGRRYAVVGLILNAPVAGITLAYLVLCMMNPPFR